MSCSRQVLPLLLSLALLPGCQRARPYDPRPSRPAAAESVKKTESHSNHDWIDAGGAEIGRQDLPLVFVHQGTQPEEWAKLPRFWNEPDPAGAGPRAIRIKVPLGLGPVTPHLPASNPPTRSKWELGRKLFSDPSWLTAQGDTSCATCHIPSKGYTDDRRQGAGGYNTPTLINCVYNSHQFWDGRVRYLEEVVQSTVADEHEVSDPGRSHHAWPGVIARLRANPEYSKQFNAVFAAEPTQDALGKALATYLRTLLAGDSLQDRAEQVRASKKAATLDASHYEGLLDQPTLERLERPRGTPAVVAADLVRGAALFTGKAGCGHCHPVGGTGTYRDGQFHNIGVGVEGYTRVNRDKRPGRFAVAPFGEKNRFLIGAYKTPTLRSLVRTAPYFHDGETDTLEQAVRLHVDMPGVAAPFNFYLDPFLSDESGNHRQFDLDRSEIDALVLFLRALDGGEVDPVVRGDK